jgi:hypothetical protein
MIDPSELMTAKELALLILSLPEEQQNLPFTWNDDHRHPVTFKQDIDPVLKVINVENDTAHYYSANPYREPSFKVLSLGEC